MKCTIYDNQSGEILRTIECPEYMIDAQAGIGESVINIDSDDSTQYVENGVIVDKPTSTVNIDKLNCIADGLDSVNLTGIIPGSKITIRGNGIDHNTIISADNESMTFDTPGDYEITISSFPYLDYKVIVHGN